jgi:hypothetical protein
MFFSIVEDWRLLTEAQKIVVTCCTTFTNSNETTGDQKARWESKAAIQDKTIVSENSWKFTFLCSSKEIHKVTQTSKEIHK